MEKSKKILAITLVILSISSTLTGCSENMVMTNLVVVEGKPIKVAQISKELTDDYIEDINKLLKDIQEENEGKVETNFYDSK